MKTCFSEGKLMKQFGSPRLTNPLISEQFFHDPPLKKMVKPLKDCFFGKSLHKKGITMGCTQNENHFFDRNNKNRS